MKKMSTIYATLIILFVVATASVKSDPNANTGRTGATGSYCTSCHNDYLLNAGGGSVTVSGLPLTTYTPGQAYPFTVTVNYPVADRFNWGFAIKAVNPTGGAAIGTFTTTNTTYTRISSSEATSKNAPVTASGATTYTFTGLTWTAPATASATALVKFYYTGNAGDNDGSANGDYIYTGTLSVALPISLISFSGNAVNNTIALNWQVENDITTSIFEIERANANGNYEKIGTLNGSNTNTAFKYSFIDTKPNAATNLYRLKMIEKDGNVQYSQVLSVATKNKADYVSNIYPNPIKNGQSMTIELVSQKKQMANILVYNQQGKLMSTRERELNCGTNNINLKPGNFLLAGNYYLVIQINNQTIKQAPFIVVE